MTKASQTLLIVAGDPSGDIHAARVVEAMSIQQPAISWVGVGGAAMQAAGVELLANQSHLGKVGLYGLSTVWSHFQLGQRLLRWIKTHRPAVVLHVDYGGFNLWLAGQCKKRGFHTQWGLKNIHYIPPQVWASRKQRLNTIKRVMDEVLCIFPFEEGIYRANSIPVTFVGHPLVGTLPPPAERNTFCAQHGLNPHQPLVAVFPGSRHSEVNHLLRPSLEALALLNQRRVQNGLPCVQAVVPVASSFNEAWVEQRVFQWQQHAAATLPVTLVKSDQRHALLSVADAGMIKSGTSTLEAALYRLPQVVIYKGHPLAAWLARRLCYLKSWGLPNVLINPNDPIVPECLQEDCNPEALADMVAQLLQAGSPLRQKALAGYTQVAELLLTHDQHHSAERVAEALLAAM
ncbi:MAG: lipid-A-disaccharide synthase [Vampirovibrionales bacterium]